MKRKLRMGMVGGGPGAFIGDVHRRAARINGDIDLVAGVFSSNWERNREKASELFIPENRCYRSWQELFEGESALPEDERMDFVSIVTPNALHFPVSDAALAADFHVMCEKPMTMNVSEALRLRDRVESSGKLFGLMHNYSAYPMVRQMRQMVRDGLLGDILKVSAEYILGWLSKPYFNKQSTWRVDPKLSGGALCMADVGTHAQHLIHFVTGMEMTELNADLTCFVEGREIDDDGVVLVHYDNGARGIISCSLVSTGEENNFSLRIYGNEGGLEWHQQSPEELILSLIHQPKRVIRRNWAGACQESRDLSRLPAGHPEGFLEAFANVYRAFADAIHDTIKGNVPTQEYPGVQDGISEMVFLETLLKNAASKEKWTAVPNVEDLRECK